MIAPRKHYCICDREMDRAGVLCAYCSPHRQLVEAFAEGLARLADPERKPERPA